MSRGSEQDATFPPRKVRSEHERDGAATRPGTSWRRTRLIAMRELRERFGQRAYKIALVVGAVLAAAAVVVPTLFEGDDSSPQAQEVPVAFVGVPAGEARTRAAALETAAGGGSGAAAIRVQVVDEATAARLVRDGDDDLALVIRGGAVAPQATVLGREGANPETAGVARALERAAVAARLEALRPGDRTRVLAPVPVTVVAVPSSGPTTAATAVVSVMGFLVYFAGLMITTSFATGLVSDRANRVTERLLTAAQPQEHLAGKLLGVGAAGGLQFAAWIAGGLLAAAAVAGSLGDTFEGVPVEMLAFFPVAIVLTYAIYGALATVLVLPVRKTEDVGAALAPATILQIVAFIATSSILGPGATVSSTAQVLSLVPFFSPLLMLARLAGGDVPAWELAFAVASTLLLAALLIRLAAPAYARHAIDAPGGKGLGAVLATLRS